MKKITVFTLACMLAIGAGCLAAVPAGAQEGKPITQAVVTPATNTVQVSSAIGLNLVMGEANDGYFMVYDRLGKKHPVLTDYSVSIPPGGRTDALVQTVITWDWEGSEIRTRGLDADQTEAAIKATFKMLNLIENKDINNRK